MDRIKKLPLIPPVHLHTSIINGMNSEREFLQVVCTIQTTVYIQSTPEMAQFQVILGAVTYSDVSIVFASNALV